MPVDGWVQVGEFGQTGSRLRLDEDLGITRGILIELGAAYRFSDRRRFTFSLGDLILRGEETALATVVYDEGIFPPGTELRSTPLFFRLKGTYEQTLWDVLDRFFLDLLLGVEYIYLDFKIEGTDPSGEKIREGEQFWKQELPLPFVGAAVRYTPTDRWTIGLSSTWISVHRLNSLRHEGGLVRLTQTNFETNLSAGYRPGERLSFDAGYRLWSFVQEEKSGQDDNRFHLRTLAPFFRIEYGF
jgi:hypothetical protein